jgi:hypothetical protein
MAYFSKTEENRQLDIYKALQEKVSAESQQMFTANKCKPGQYKGRWFELLEDWMGDNISNIHIYDCLRVGHVLELGLD